MRRASQASRFRERYGPWAVIAGSSAGLGAEYARQLAEIGLHVVLVARRETELRKLAAELEAHYHVETRTLALDLEDEATPGRITEACADLDIGLLVYNAARSLIGPFLDAPLEDHLAEVAVNVRGPLALAWTFGRKLRARGRGGLILMGSLSATQGSALIANYTATKAYNQILAEGLWEELRAEGVDVLACVPAAIATPNFAASGAQSQGAADATTLTPEAVARAGLAALGHGPVGFPGFGVKVGAFVTRRLLPRALGIRMMGSVMRRMYASPSQASEP
jgi:short-subunit dehydrogenase